MDEDFEKFQTNRSKNHYGIFQFYKTWKYNIRRNVNSGPSNVAMRRVAIRFFELGVVKNFMQKF